MHDRRPGVVVDEDHVAFAPPDALKVRDGLVAADELAGAFGLQDDIVALSVEVGFMRRQ